MLGEPFASRWPRRKSVIVARGVQTSKSHVVGICFDCGFQLILGIGRSFYGSFDNKASIFQIN